MDHSFFEMGRLPSWKTIHCLGDSITFGIAASEGNSWVSRLASRLPEAQVNNYGVSGSTLADWPERDDCFFRRYREMAPEADLIIVSGGINDFNHGIPLGTPASDQPGEFYGALNLMIPDLIRRYPLADFCFITPMKAYGFKDYPHWDTENASGHRLVDYRDAILEVCGRYSVPVLDLFSVSGLTPDIPEAKELLMPDGLHPSDLGHARVFRKIFHFLERL